jgi:hypothetical protein
MSVVPRHRWIVWGFSVCLILFASLPARAQAIVEEFAPQIRSLQPLEAAYVLKSAENELGRHNQIMFADPENAKDGYLWALKVIAGQYAVLTLISEAAANGIAPYYRERTEIVMRLIRGETTAEVFTRQEAENEAAKGAYLDGMLTGAQSSESADALEIAALNDLALRLASQVRGVAVLATSN